MIKGYFQMGFEPMDGIYALRREVFGDELGWDEPERDPRDMAALHAVIENDGRLCAVGMLYFADGVWNIGRMAVAADMRGQHIGDLLGRMLLDRALASGADEVRAAAGEDTRGFFEKLSFTGGAPMTTDAERIRSRLFGGCGGDCARCTSPCGEEKTQA